MSSSPKSEPCGISGISEAGLFQLGCSSGHPTTMIRIFGRHSLCKRHVELTSRNACFSSCWRLWSLSASCTQGLHADIRLTVGPPPKLKTYIITPIIWGGKMKRQQQQQQQQQQHSLNSVCSRTTWVNQHQKCKPFYQSKRWRGGSGISWTSVQIIYTSHQIYNHTSTSSFNVLQTRCSFWCPINSVEALIVMEKYISCKKPALTRVQKPMPTMFLWLVTFDLLTPK